MKDKVGTQDKISFVLNGKPVAPVQPVAPAPPPTPQQTK
jgi:hypothetical protein